MRNAIFAGCIYVLHQLATTVRPGLSGTDSSIQCQNFSPDYKAIQGHALQKKAAQLAQLVQGPPPSFDELDAYLFCHPDINLPVSDTKYYSLVAANEALVSEMEPASASGAEALAEVVTAALRMQYEPVEDEISLAGVQTFLAVLSTAI
ncbi:hypothetical protein ABBQ32_007754 [Trebouxia sp. C0010 RCD-2024]